VGRELATTGNAASLNVDWSAWRSHCDPVDCGGSMTMKPLAI
jgi:hypothetical protein